MSNRLSLIVTMRGTHGEGGYSDSESFLQMVARPLQCMLCGREPAVNSKRSYGDGPQGTRDCLAERCPCHGAWNRPGAGATCRGSQRSPADADRVATAPGADPSPR